MRRTLVSSVVCLLLAGAAAGCSSDDDGGGEAGAKPSATAAPSQSVDPVVPFMKAIADADLASYAEDGIPPFQELEQFPPRWCRALDEGHSVEWMFDPFQGGLYPIGEEWGTAKPDAHQVLLMGVEAYCPEHVEAVREDLRASGEY